MAVKYSTIYASPGINFVEDSALINRVIIAVHRSGLQYDIVYETPGNRQVYYMVNEGRLVFQNDFTGSTVGRPNRFTFEDVKIVYR